MAGAWGWRWTGTAVVGDLLVAGCSTGASTPTTSHPPSLAQDQAAVDKWTAAVASDRQSVAAAQTNEGQAYEQYASLMPSCVGTGVPCGNADQPALNRYNAAVKPAEDALKAAQSQLSKDQFRLQVAQDQLTKDEG